MTLAFYKGGKTWFDKIVCWVTGGKHTHVELVFSDGLSFSSSQWDGGVRFKSIWYDPQKWDFVQIKVQVNLEQTVRDWCSSQEKKKYDWMGILGLCVSSKDLEDSRKWFCSEICVAALQQVRIYMSLVPSQTTPTSLYTYARLEKEYV